MKFWKENSVFEKSIQQRAKARDFVFYEGPPTANAKAGIHHLLARVFKDIICRYKTMAGFKVLRKAGWDTHGLPVEIEIEKKLGIKTKKDIEKYTLSKFNKQCQKSVWRYKQDWEKLTERIGYWLDMKEPYITNEADYIESVWRLLKEIWRKGLLEQDYKVMPYCPRCGTSLSSHEVAQGYKKIAEPAIFVKFRLKQATSLLVWTTTPWTLPGNVAIAVNPKFIYAKVKVNDEYLILAKERLKDCGIEGKIVDEYKGKDLIGLKYKPLYKNSSYKLQVTSYKIISGDFVSAEEGTGLVHIAPAFGEDDMAVGKKNNLPVLMTVDKNGCLTSEVKQWAGMFVKEADPLIILDLEKRNLLFKKEMYEHDYPFCWRCKTPLIYYAKKSWFIRMTKVKKQLIRNNQKINWIPSHLKDGRFGEWLNDLKDWAISRERYWGTPLPIWRCKTKKSCNNVVVIGSKQDLLNQKFSTNKYYILRHGHSCRQKRKILACWPEKIRCGLTEKGKRQIEKAVKKLTNKKIDIIYSSDLLRTRQTAEIAAKKIGVKVKYDSRLREMNLGVYNGKPVAKFAKEFPDYGLFYKRPLKGENWIDCQKRMFNFIKSLNKKHKNKKILIVSHGDPLWLLESAMKGLNQEQTLEQKLKRTFVDTGELRKIDFKNLPYNKKMELDFHRPFIDEVKFFCPKCKEIMERVPEVIDCWFDSGAMPFAQAHWPFDNHLSLKPPKQFPADYICEAVDQTRGWFYTLLAISTLLGFGPSYKNVISVGHVLDKKGEKMSKSKGNVVDPWYIMEKYGSDAVRWYFYTVNQPGDSKLFKEKDIEQALKKFIMTLWNVFSFFETYVPKKEVTGYRLQVTGFKNILDRWIISKLNELILDVSERLDKYDITGAARDIEGFTLNDLSLWYVRRSRKRFHLIPEQSSARGKKTKRDFEEASSTLGFVLATLSRLSAPFAPFLSEEIYQKIGGKKNSVHLENWPKSDKKLIDKKLEWQMKIARDVVASALAQRAKAGIKVRQPLNELRIKNYELRNIKEFLELIKAEVNVKKITFGKSVKLDTKITSELKEEGLVREVIRQIQEMRKKAGYKPRHRILIRYFGNPEMNKILARNRNFILKEIRAENFLVGDRPKRVFDVEKEMILDGQKLWLGIKKI